MTENPYQSSDTTLIGEVQSASPRRPAGVWLIAVLLLLSGIARLGTSIFILSTFRRFELLTCFDLAVTIPLLVGVAGLFLGRRWGWMVITTLTVLGVLNKLWILCAAAISPNEVVSSDTVMHLVFAFVFVSVLQYFYRDHVLDYFRVPSQNRLAILGGQAAFCLLLLASRTALFVGHFSNLE